MSARAISGRPTEAGIVSIVATVFGLGPFAASRLSDSLLPLQLFMAVVALTTLFLGSVVSERDRALHDAQQAIRVRDVFLAVAAHELRTPLASLQLQVSNLRELVKLGAITTEQLLTKFGVIERQGDRLGALVANLLDVSQAMAGKFQLVYEPLDVRDVVIAVVGDSMSSGEGDPDRARLWQFDTSPVEWMDERCHRSMNSGGARAALQFERDNPHLSVTLLNYACSGARTRTAWCS